MQWVKKLFCTSISYYKFINLHCFRMAKNTKVTMFGQVSFLFFQSNSSGSCLHLIQVNLCQKLFFLQTMGRTCCVKKLSWMSETIYVHNMFSPGLSLEFSCIELILWVSWCKNRSFWQRLTCTEHLLLNMTIGKKRYLKNY